MKQFVAFAVIAIILVSFLLILGPPAAAETVYVCISDHSYLNGRCAPSKNAEVTMKLFNGDELEIVALRGEWAEVVGGESGTSFCKIKYLSEIREPVSFTNTSGGRVRVRHNPVDGKTVGWIEAGKTVTVSKQILGWGYTKSGWVDLSYFTLN